MDPKSLTTMSNTKGVSGWQKKLSNFVCKTLSPITPPTRFRNVSFWTVRVLVLSDFELFGCRWFSQLWRVTEPLTDLGNSQCGHDTRGNRVLMGEVYIATTLYTMSVIPDGTRVVSRLIRIHFISFPKVNPRVSQWMTQWKVGTHVIHMKFVCHEFIYLINY